MIYRADDCGIYDDSEPLTTVWFEAYTDRQAGERVQALLALIWHVEPERIVIGGSVTCVGTRT